MKTLLMWTVAFILLGVSIALADGPVGSVPPGVNMSLDTGPLGPDWTYLTWDSSSGTHANISNMPYGYKWDGTDFVIDVYNPNDWNKMTFETDGNVVGSTSIDGALRDINGIAVPVDNVLTITEATYVQWTLDSYIALEGYPQQVAVRVHAVPETKSLALAAFGLIGVLAVACKR